MCDGDKLLVIKDNNLTKVVKRNMEGIVPLYYDMKKAQAIELNKDSIYTGMITAYSSGNIGPYSNNISKIWNREVVSEQELNVIRWLCMENNFVIDFAKTLYMPTRPSEVDEIIKSYTNQKLPNFFIQAKNKTEEQVEEPTQSTMNKLASKIPDTRISYCETLGKFDYKNLMSGKYNPSKEDKEAVIAVYDYWSKRRNIIFNHVPDDYISEESLYVYQELRDRIVEEVDKPIEFIVDCLVEFLYKERKDSTKKVLWASFGDVIDNNVDCNLAHMNPICPICWKRFKPKSNSQKCCSEKCARELDIINKRNERKR